MNFFNNLIFTDSILKKYLLLSLAFGILMGIVFRCVTPFFVEFKSNTLADFFTIMCISAGIMVGYFSYWFGKQFLLNTIFEVGDFTKKLSEGDFTQNLIIKSSDRIGEFANDYNSLIANLKGTIIAIHNLTIELTDSLEEQKSATSLMAANSQIISEKNDLIGDLSLHNSKNLFYLSNQFKALKMSIETLMGNINTLTSIINLNQRIANDSLTKTQSIDFKLLELDNRLHKLNNSIENIFSSSQKINNVLTILKSISEKINLLALNASIEAARAGEQGKGFSVVSEEISKLANKTKKNIDDITNLLNLNKEEVKFGIESFSNTSEYLATIVTDTKDIFRFIETFHKNIETQLEINESVISESKSSNEISDEIQSEFNKYDSSLQQIISYIHELNDFGTENASASEEISASSNEISGFSQVLAEKVKFFRFE
jgi:methyl-accepting chemotaxis protein